MKTVLSDARVRKYTRLAVYPQHRYEYNEFRERFPKYTLIPNLYISHHSFEVIRKPERHRACYIIRDPRNVVVSWYYSMRDTHRLINPQVVAYRERLQNLDYDQGIRYCIEELAVKFAFIRSWLYRAEDANVLVMKFEDLVASPVEGMQKFMAHCEVTIPEDVLRRILNDYTKEKMRARDLQRRLANTSSYGMRSTNWWEAISENNLRFFYETTGDLIELMGYER